MAESQPIHCRPLAYHLLKRQLPKLDTSEGLVAAAVAIASHEIPDADLADVKQRLQVLAGRIRSRVRRNSPQALLAHLHDVLFDVEGFGGATEDFYNPANSYLPIVLNTKRGIPISLSLIYKAVAERIGLQVRGVNSPGHFLVAVASPGSWMLVDPFSGGRVLTRDEAIAQIQERFGDDTGINPSDMLRTATHRQWLARMLQNLHGIFARSGRRNDVAAMLELQSLL